MRRVVILLLLGALAGTLLGIESGGAVYLPVNDRVDADVQRAEQLYRTRPNAVRRAIVSAQSSSATAFADAFKLRRDSDG